MMWRKSFLMLYLIAGMGVACAQELRTGNYPDGSLRYRGWFKEGKPSGEMTRFFPGGGIQAKMNYRGDTVDAVLYSRSGEYTLAGKYVNRQKTGEWVYRKNERLVASAEYRNNLPDGPSRRYSRDGVLLEQKGWKAGKPEGEWVMYYPAGTLRLKAFYVAGKLDGSLQAYNRQGGLKAEGEYRNGLKEGRWVYYNDEGKTVRTEVYQRGVPEDADRQELEESRRLDELVNAGEKIPDPAVFADDPEAYMRLTGIE